MHYAGGIVKQSFFMLESKFNKSQNYLYRRYVIVFRMNKNAQKIIIYRANENAIEALKLRALFLAERINFPNSRLLKAGSLNKSNVKRALSA